jgi:glycosidase/predicted alpha/beta superfamily hydrolase
MTKWLLSAALSLLVANVCAASGIERLEPAFWWVGMKDSHLQLMVHGERIAELAPAIEYPGVAIVGVTRTDNPNYLFINLTLAESTHPGRFRIDFGRDSVAVLSHEYELLAREPGSAARVGFGPGDVIYLVTPDRFANGNPGNDGVAGYRQGPDRRDPNGRHGGDLQGLLDHLDYVAGMGFTQLWLNPVLQNDQPQGSYHGYAITDYYQVDARFGDNALYRTLSLEARERGVGLIMDVVLNHCGLEHWWMRDPPARDWINHGGHFAGTSHNHESLQDPHGAAADRDAMSSGWFVPTMPDLNQRNPLLATYLIQNSLWWIEYAGLSGLRVDTWPYSDKDFLVEWTRRVMAEYPALNIVGEEWSTDPAIVSYWQRGKSRTDGYISQLPSLMDFPLQDAAVRAFGEEEGRATGLIRIYRALADDSLYADPYNLVVFPDNHDMSRILTQLGGRPELDRMATTFFLTTRGIPQQFYGDEILMANPGTDAHGVIRSDFPGGWAGDAVSGFTGEGLKTTQREAREYTRRLLQWRKGADAIHRGRLTQFAPVDGSYVYFRQSDRQKIMVVINKSLDAQRLDTARFQEMIGGDTLATDVLTGQQHRLDQSLEVPGSSATVLELTPAGDTGAGKLVLHERFASKHVDARNIEVWLPPGYDQEPEHRYPVLYMHDGQNLFDASPWRSISGVNWGMDTAIARLMRQGTIRGTIVVGIWTNKKRFEELMPQKAVTGDKVDGVNAERLLGDRYLRFLVEELKPFIDATYRTLPGRADTFVMGSSMGGLMSAYAISEYPGVFGGAGCVSTHWPLDDGIVIDYLEKHLPAPPGHRFYFDFGTATLDAAYEPYQRRVDELMRRSGYAEGVNWITRKYEGHEHSERDWRARVDAALKFLLGR